MLLQANALRIPLADESVHCVVTSPPYWGLRDYGIGDQLGLEATIDEYVANMVAVFREVKRVLRSDGVCWINLGDSYSGDKSGGRNDTDKMYPGSPDGLRAKGKLAISSGLKPKDLCGVPWRVAFALQADGWWLRSDCIWAKPNPMPESVTDRPTKSHEYVFLLTKAANYFYDADAVREENADPSRTNYIPGARTFGINPDRRDNDMAERMRDYIPSGRNLRTVWTIATAPYSGAHFATFPPALVERCIRAGTSERGACPVCGRQWERVVERGPAAFSRQNDREKVTFTRSLPGRNDGEVIRSTLGWRPTCDHDNDPIPATVFDPFVGSGTTVAVAQQLGRRGVGIDLSLPYLHLARERTGAAALAEWMNGKKNGKENRLEDLPMFQVRG